MARGKITRRKSDGMGYKFLIVSLLIIMFVIFIIGLQIGRIVEKTSREAGGSRVVTRTFDEEDIGQKIRGDIERMRDSKNERSQAGTDIVPSETQKLPKETMKKPVEKKRDVASKPPESRVRKAVPEIGELKREMLFLQVGVFSVENNAENMKIRLEKYGFKVRIETHKTNKGDLLRKVLVGPFFSAEEVTREREKIRRLTGTRPVLVKRQG